MDWKGMEVLNGQDEGCGRRRMILRSGIGKVNRCLVT